jgi:hypothetical protein
MSLKSRDEIIAKERHYSLEDYSEESSDLEKQTDNNMMSVIELPSVEQGKYQLEIFVNKLLFMEDSKI